MFEELDLKIGEGTTGDYLWTYAYPCPRPSFNAACHSNSSCAGSSAQLCC